MAYGDKFYLYVEDTTDNDLDLVTTYDMVNDSASDWTGETSFATDALVITQTAPLANDTITTATRSSFNAPAGRNRLRVKLGSIGGDETGVGFIYVKKDSDNSVIATCDFLSVTPDGTIDTDAFDLDSTTLVYIQFDAINRGELTGRSTNDLRHRIHCNRQSAR